jgi:hypothetical protein
MAMDTHGLDFRLVSSVVVTALYIVCAVLAIRQVAAMRVSQADLLAHARKHKALYPQATNRELRTQLQQFFADHDWGRRLPREWARHWIAPGHRGGCFWLILLGPPIAVRNCLVRRRQARMIEEAIAVVQKEPGAASL